MTSPASSVAARRFHVHVAVDDLEASTAFYTGLFGAPPTVVKPDYRKWMLEDPRVNFAISNRGRATGVDHLGIQVETREDLGAMQQRLDAAGLVSFAKGATTCCYARSEKTWTRDPQGIAWETFHTTGEATTYGEGRVESGAPTVSERDAKAACCAPDEHEPRKSGSSCCAPGAC